MAEAVTYTDLRFVKAPDKESNSSRLQQAGVDDGELTYENVQETQVKVGRNKSGTEPRAEPAAAWRLQFAALILLGACLFLLASAIGLGVRYRQVSQELQRATQAHAAESSSLARSISTKEESLEWTESWLESAEQELNRTQGMLQECQEVENRTQGQLQQTEEELERMQNELERAEKEKGDIKAQLQEKEAALAEAHSCEKIGWVRYRGKCLFIAREKKNWEESKKSCESKSSRLLVLGSWGGELIPSFLQGCNGAYWIGLRRERSTNWPWRWIDTDNTQYTRTMLYERWGNNCAEMSNGRISAAKCSQKSPYICEQPASPALGV